MTVKGIKLKALEGAPKSVKGNFIVGSNPLRDLNGSPEIVYKEHRLL